MRRRLTVLCPQARPRDVELRADAALPVGVAAARLREALAPAASRAAAEQLWTLAVADGHGRWRGLDPLARIGRAMPGNGSTVAVVRWGRWEADAPAATLVEEGAGRVHRLGIGVTRLGRAADAEVSLRHPTVSRTHAAVQIGWNAQGVIAVLSDTRSANGTTHNGAPTRHCRLSGGSVIGLGEVRLRFRWARRAAEDAGREADDARGPSQPAEDGRVRHLRAAPPAPRRPPAPVPLPAEPAEERRPRAQWQWAAMLVPALGAAAFAAITGMVESLAFAALGPLGWAAGEVERRVSRRRRRSRDRRDYEARLRATLEDLRARQRDEARRRCEAWPRIDDLVGFAELRTPQLWQRRPGMPGFLRLLLGFGPGPAEPRLTPPPGALTITEAQERLVRAHARASRTPVEHDLATEHLGIAAGADAEHAAGMIRALALQLVTLHSPGEVRLAVVSLGSEEGWEWLAWCDHAHHHLAPGGALAAFTATRAGALAAALREVARDGGWVVVCVVGDAAEATADLLSVAEEHSRVRLVWVADQGVRLPGPVPLRCDLGSTPPSHVREDARATIRTVWAPPHALLRATKALSRVRDATIRAPDGALPERVSLREVLGAPEGGRARWLTDRWCESPRHPLEAPIGMDGHGPVLLDLERHGPHAVVGGTTGAGKSELLQTWILGMAARSGPDRVTFLLVDYKGGAAFAEVSALPHTVGVLTDLDEGLAPRALVSLRAEIHHRERILARHGARDLRELRARAPASAPPSLVIVIDEFATLVQEFPDFLDGVVDLAARGRSLGIHLVLATQRPAGVITDRIRANCQLRVALRVTGPEESRDIVDDACAAGFPRRAPGRAAVRVGSDPVRTVQTAYAGAAGGQAFRLRELTPHGHGAWMACSGSDGPSDAAVLIEASAQAAGMLGLPPPRRPWLPPLPHVLTRPMARDLVRDASAGRDALWVAVADRPHTQEQAAVAFSPREHGHAAVFGPRGSGKTTAVQTLVTQALNDERAWMYAVIDRPWPQEFPRHPRVGAVAVLGDDERIGRILHQLEGLLAHPETGRCVLFVVDGFDRVLGSLGRREADAFESALQRVLSEGPAAGIHLMLAASRPQAIGAAFRDAVGFTLELGPGDDATHSRSNAAGSSHWPGLGSCETKTSRDGVCQVILDDPPSTSIPVAHPAPPVPAMPTRVMLSELPVRTAGGDPCFGVDGDGHPVGLPLRGVVAVQGETDADVEEVLGAVLEGAARAIPEFDLVVVEDGPDLDGDPWAGGAHRLVVVPHADRWFGGSHEDALARLLRGAHAGRGCVVVGVDPSRPGEGWELGAALRLATQGVVLGRADDEPRFLRFRHEPWLDVGRSGLALLVRGSSVTPMRVATVAPATGRRSGARAA